MFPLPLLATLAAAVFSTAVLAQSTPSSSDPDKTSAASSGSSEAAPPASAAHYDMEDCRKDMANAREAKQAGHITEREYAEQKKMAQAKLKRDSGRDESAQKGMGCQ
ncbi:hypothetical protein [Noviherbaspirillum denitrificans]|uniref:SHOCT domain-containing protein n=1 Tax=Noviherbaspirillum denitrificans TaxID=1968433 RepID=A0A254TBC5_9BURK|nr:hypothetical protein [Noviherbaspirillum denitrificans]OWW19934.1 hypothetical protein AYR66_10900 [Noviherbaspirillum denitrificans]